MRYSLRTLLIAMLFAAVLCLALRAPSAWWSGGMFVVLILALLTSVLIAIYRAGQIRAMAIGFGIFSSGYLCIEANFWPGGSPGLTLPTDDLIQWSFDRLHRTDRELPSGVVADDPFAPDSQRSKFFAYRGICITTLALAMGFIGATIARVLDRTSRTPLRSTCAS